MAKRKYYVLLLLIVVLITGIVIYTRPNQEERSHTGTGEPGTAQSGDRNQTTSPRFNKTQQSLNDPASPWVIVNKRRPLSPATYAPPLATPNVPLRLQGDGGDNPEMQVSTQIVSAMERLFAAAKTDGLDLMLASGYRSYQQQVIVYNAEVKQNGQAAADRESARPGHSEHQTGLAIDVEPASRQCEVQVCFGELPEGKWVAAHAHEHGFIIRYANGSEPVTGYSYEPWHLRYVGKELATEVHRQGNPPLETFFGLGAAPDY